MKSQRIAWCAALGAALAASMPLFGLQDQPRAAGGEHHMVRHAAAALKRDAGEEGERVFEQNCARCHNAPDGFSPRITGTIVRHMRVRANLSAHDEQVLLRYFNQ